MSVAVIVRHEQKSRRIYVFVVLTGLSAIYDPASWARASLTRLMPSSKGAATSLPLGWVPFRPITPEEDNGTGRIEVAEHRCR
jgi:hypothetical protein